MEDVNSRGTDSDESLELTAVTDFVPILRLSEPTKMPADPEVKEPRHLQSSTKVR